MKGAAIVDTNLLALLVIGSTSKNYISSHKRIKADFKTYHFELLVELLGAFEDIILLPQVVAETSNLLRYIEQPAKNNIQMKFKTIVESTVEFPITSLQSVMRNEYLRFGITDSAILHLCKMKLNGLAPTLFTIDGDLANAAASLGYKIIDYREFMN